MRRLTIGALVSALGVVAALSIRVWPYECHEGNHALNNILSAARAEDRAIAEAVAKGLPHPKPSSWLGGVNPAAPDQWPSARSIGHELTR